MTKRLLLTQAAKVAKVVFEDDEKQNKKMARKYSEAFVSNAAEERRTLCH
jgi:hypothetical protein